MSTIRIDDGASSDPSSSRADFSRPVMPPDETVALAALLDEIRGEGVDFAPQPSSK